MFAIPQFITCDPAGPTIASIATASGFTTILDVTSDPNRIVVSGGRSWGLWFDGPLVPYRASASTEPYVILALGQSNIWLQRSHSWSPASNARVWNNAKADDTSVGTAFTALSGSLVGVADYRAHLIAQANPDRDVRLIVLASGSLDIGHFDDGNVLSWDGTSTANSDPGATKIRANNANLALATAFYCDDLDTANSDLTTAYQLIQNGHKIEIRDNSTPANKWFYTATGPATDNGGYWTIPVSYVSGSGALSDGVRLITQPDYQKAMNSVVPAALAAAGVSSIDEIVWWQIESNTRYSTEARYKAQFESVMTKIQAKSWADANTKVVMFSGSNTALTGNAWSDKGPEWISELAALNPSVRRYVNLTGLSSSLWTDGNLHMTAAGYIAAAELSMKAYAPEINNAAMFLCGTHSTYRYLVKNNNWSSGNISHFEPDNPVRTSSNTGIQQDYDHRAWVFGVYADGANLYGIGHHEWYHDRITVSGYPGFNNQLGHKWVTSPIWLKSTENGARFSWSTKPYTSYTVSGSANPARLYLTPEAYGVQSYDTMYGWQHPSNIVYPPDIGQTDDPYYYCFLDANNLVGAGDTLLDIGFSLIRWSNPNDPTSVQYWNGSGWTARNMSAYQGNNGTQQPYVFFKVTGFDPYTQFGRTDRMAQRVCWHTPTQQWLLFGFDGRVNPSFVFTRSKTLANPQFEANGRTQIPYTGGGVNGDYTGVSYITVFDPTSTDQNFTDIGNSPLCVVADNYLIFKKQTLAITVS